MFYKLKAKTFTIKNMVICFFAKTYSITIMVWN